jgi:hypothetical protein
MVPQQEAPFKLRPNVLCLDYFAAFFFAVQVMTI